MPAPSTTSAETVPPVSANGQEPGVPTTVILQDHGRGRRWPAALVGAAVGVAGTVAALTLLGGEGETDDVSPTSVELATVSVGQQDLIEEIEWAGVLGSGDPVVLAGSGGIVTGTVAVGDTIGRGDTIAEVDGQPVIALYGDQPMWRPVTQGDTGADVRLLEANLAALGFDPDQTVDIDTSFTANTAAMVERWQEEVGLEVTGSVGLGSVVIVEGPSVVSSVVDVGSVASGPLVTVAPRSVVTDVVATVDGTVTSVASAGTAVEHGTVLYEVDDIPVVALVGASSEGGTGGDPVMAAMTDQTFTDLELEQALADAGHDQDGDMTVDGVVTDATGAAIERWQVAAGLPVTGEADPGYYLLVPAGRVVEDQLVAEGAIVIDGGPIAALSSPRFGVEIVVDVASADEFAVGQEVTIELADETTAAGVVADIGPVVQPADPQGSPTVTIDISVTPDAGSDPVEGPVTVISTGDVIRDAVVVPTRALVSLAEGGFAVERIGPEGEPLLIGIELGSFDDGVVEVLDGDLSPGDEIVVPR